MSDHIVLQADRSVRITVTPTVEGQHARAIARLYSGETVNVVEHIYPVRQYRGFVIHDITKRVNFGGIHK